MSISKATNGSLAKNKKLNEVIDALNSIITMAVREGAEGEGPGFTFGELRSELITTGGGEGGGGGGTFELDVVKDDNTAGRASFMGDGII
tara:strand:+ start:399 stop:668 length:270 start_codon:yes stop_codon:yes gene_type:complete